ncbi:ubiquitin-conjugating enzyme E2 30 [Drosophila madeirensis]|uniref:Ubiquitin-conjugating enzyme E2 30 n=1 Tax=Drosophila madeirensis TaxID=30013 RepID=A0AAU9FFR1_DROMD
MPPRDKGRQVEEDWIAPTPHVHLALPRPPPPDLLRRRILSEYRELELEPPEGCRARIVGNDFRHWYATIFGPLNSPYKGGFFHLAVRFPLGYPTRKPSVTFLSENGRKSLEFPLQAWTPTRRIHHILAGIREMLSTPSSDKWKENDFKQFMWKDQ